MIGRYGVGVDNVDLDAATHHGIAVINVPDYCVEEVATHTAALVLAARRKLAQSRSLIDDGRWRDWQALRPVEPLSTSTLGLVGIGRIGGEVARLLGPFFWRIIAFDPVLEPPAGCRGRHPRRGVRGGGRRLAPLPAHAADARTSSTRRGSPR